MSPGFKAGGIGMKGFGRESLEDEVFVVFKDRTLSAEKLREEWGVVSRSFEVDFGVGILTFR